MTVLSCQDGIHLGWRRRPGLDGGLGGSSWNVNQVKELRARLWASKAYFTECLRREVTSLQAEKRRTVTEAGNLSPKALCEESFGSPETGSELAHLLHIP
jgi:hypothetical protein